MIDNALNHTPEGGSITITTALRGRKVLITVADTGSGITGIDPARVFDRFAHSTAPSASGRRSYGLGLALVREIAVSAGGTIDVAATGPIRRQSWSLCSRLPAWKISPTPLNAASFNVHQPETRHHFQAVTFTHHSSESDSLESMSNPQILARRLGTFDAVVIGLGSMIGAGVFAAFTPAAQAAGSGLLIGLAVAAVCGLLQCELLRPARRSVPNLRRQLCLRP